MHSVCLPVIGQTFNYVSKPV